VVITCAMAAWDTLVTARSERRPANSAIGEPART